MRRVPASPEVERAALDRMLDRAPAPAVPAGLVARIVREVPLMAQMPAREDAAEAALPPALVPTLSPALSIVQPAAQPAPYGSAALPKRFRGWWIAGAGGLGALAAGIAAVAMMGSVEQAAPVPDHAASVPLAAAPAAVPAPAQPVAGTQPRPAAAPLLAAAPRVQTAPLAKQPQARAGDQAPAELAPAIEPALPGSNPPEALAVASPVQPQSDDSDGSGPVPVVGPRGQMGPSLPQGFGYTGGAPGGIPAGSPVRMSGGPNP